MDVRSPTASLAFDSVLKVFSMVRRSTTHACSRINLGVCKHLHVVTFSTIFLVLCDSWSFFGSESRKLEHYFILSCLPTQSLCLRSNSRKREGEKKRERERERNVYFPQSFMIPATLIGNESSPATFTVLGSCGSQIPPVLLTGHPFPTLWA